MPTADATVLAPTFSPPDSDSVDERASTRHLAEIGVEAVLGAMIEQKRRSSRPSFAAIELGTDERRDDDEGPATAEPESASERFLKAR